MRVTTGAEHEGRERIGSGRVLGRNQVRTRDGVRDATLNDNNGPGASVGFASCKNVNATGSVPQRPPSTRTVRRHLLAFVRPGRSSRSSRHRRGERVVAGVSRRIAVEGCRTLASTTRSGIGRGRLTARRPCPIRKDHLAHGRSRRLRPLPGGEHYALRAEERHEDAGRFERAVGCSS